MTIKLDARKLTDALIKLQRTAERLPQMAAQVEGEALGMLIVAATANIYGTAPGARQRTYDYMRSLDTFSRTTKSTASITVRSDSPYAVYIEMGRSGLHPTDLQGLALRQSDMNSPLTLGRSGQEWWIAGPVLTSGQVYAARKLRELFVKEVRKVVK